MDLFVLRTERLNLIPFNSNQLRLYLARPEELETELGYPISRSIITARVQRAINMKLARMEDIEARRSLWYTYWMLVIRDVPVGAGLAGFKGFPGANGEAEIGYGIDPGYQGQGYMTEAVKSLLAWAFEEKLCRAGVAPNVEKSNRASQRVLEKTGMVQYEESDE